MVASLGSVDLASLKTANQGGSIIPFQNPVTGLLPNSTYYVLLDATAATIPNRQNTFFVNTTAATTGTAGASQLQLKLPGEWVFAPDLLESNIVNHLVMSVESPQRSSVAFEQARFGREPGTFGGLESSAKNDSDDLVHWQSFDNWSVPRAEKVTGFLWQGVFMDNEQMPAEYDPVNGRWELSIWSDNGDEVNVGPGTELFREVVSASEVSVTEGGSVYGLPVSNFAFNFSDSFTVEADTKYWISAVYIGDSLFSWTFGASGSAPLKQNSWTSVILPADGFIAIERSSSTASGRKEFFRWANSAMSILSVPTNDSDLDGMDDAWEVENKLDPTIDDAFVDPDSDGSTNLEEYAQKSDPQLADTDGDGLLDGVESNTGEYLDASDTGTSPLFADTDHDGLIDSVETNTGVFIDAAQPGTDPNKIDSDFDGYGDLLEIRQGLSPLDEAAHPLIPLTTVLEGNDLTDRISDGSAIVKQFPDPSEANGDAGAVFDNSLAGSGADWLTQYGDGTGDYPFIYLQITFEEAIILNRFNLGAPTNLDLGPNTWAIEGSNDGETFNTIFYRSNANEKVWTAASQVASFDAGIHFRTPQAYKTFRFAIYPDPSVEYVGEFALGEIELFGAPDSLKINSVTPLAGENAVEIRWNSLPYADVRYLVERSFNLETWETIATDLSGSTHTDDNFEAAPAKVFYQVRRTN